MATINDSLNGCVFMLAGHSLRSEHRGSSRIPRNRVRSPLSWFCYGFLPSGRRTIMFPYTPICRPARFATRQIVENKLS